MRRLSWALTSPWSISRHSSTARSMAGRVISWNTIRFTGIWGLRTSSRCHEMASPSRSSSVARKSSSTPFRSFFRP